MKYLRYFDSLWGENLIKKFAKSSYTIENKEISKIDPSKKVVVDSWILCPICSNKLNNMDHSETQKCEKCKTIFQCFGNCLKVINKIDHNVNININNNLTDVDYSNPDKIIERFLLFDYIVTSMYINEPRLECPLCKELSKDVHVSHKCPNCNLKIEILGNSLTCSINKKDLDFYKDIRNFNL